MSEYTKSIAWQLPEGKRFISLDIDIDGNHEGLERPVANYCVLVSAEGAIPSPYCINFHLFNVRHSINHKVHKVHSYAYILDNLETNSKGCNLTLLNSVDEIKTFHFPLRYVVNYYSDTIDLPDDILVKLKLDRGSFRHDLGVTLLSFSQQPKGAKCLSTFKLRVGDKYLNLKFTTR